MQFTIVEQIKKKNTEPPNRSIPKCVHAEICDNICVYTAYVQFDPNSTAECDR